MRFESRFTFTSELCEGVTVLLRRLNQIQAAKLDFSLIDARARYTRLQEEMKQIGAPEDGQPASIEYAAAFQRCQSILITEIKPAYLKAAILKIEGLDIDGTPATVDSLISDGPSDLIDEIYLAIGKEMGLTGEQQKNSQSPSTSSEAEGKVNEGTTA